MEDVERAPKLEQGGAQREIFRAIIKEGGSTRESKVREHLWLAHGISSERGVKTHLQKMVTKNLIKKESSPGSVNIWHLNESSPECFQYLGDLISRAHNDRDVANDIRDLFNKACVSDDSITKRMVEANRHGYYAYCFRALQDVFLTEFDDLDGSFGGFDGPFGGEDADCERAWMGLVFQYASISPSFFTTGLKDLNLDLLSTVKLILVSMRILLQFGEIKRDDTQSWMFVIAMLIAASNFTDDAFIRADDERTSKANTLFEMIDKETFQFYTDYLHIW